MTPKLPVEETITVPMKCPYCERVVLIKEWLPGHDLPDYYTAPARGIEGHVEGCKGIGRLCF